MMERFVAWLVHLSAGTIYAVIGAAALLENVFPPTPSDLAVALGGFLTHHQRVSAVGIWLVACLANLTGTVLVYVLARKFGFQFRTSRVGKRLLPPEAILALEREYLRFGVVGIFLGRLLPGFRSVVAPFAGLVNLPTATALIPITVATMVWYAFLAWIGARLGAEWDSISRFIGQLNRTLGLLSLVVGVAIAVVVWRRRRARPHRRDLLLRAVHRALDAFSTEAPIPAGQSAAASRAATLLHELARADREITPGEKDLITNYLREHWQLEDPRSESRAYRSIPLPAADHTGEVATVVTQRFERTRRVELINQLYRIAASDGTIGRHEERLMRRAAALLGLTGEDLEAARRQSVPPG
jgi:membrane protein DedA with SNARE-associated domain/uncharacterized tellurite resistance protein B-like protein